MAHVRTTRNLVASDVVCKSCESDANTWFIDVIEHLPDGDQRVATYFWCFVCDQES